MKLRPLTEVEIGQREALQPAIWDSLAKLDVGARLASLHLSGVLVRWHRDSATVNSPKQWAADGWLIVGPRRSDGYHFFAIRHPSGRGIRIIAGCRHFPNLRAARKHWAHRHLPPLRAETRAILNSLVAIAKARGWRLE